MNILFIFYLQISHKAGKKVLVIERRSQIGGNCYDVSDEYGILIHEYGPHIFHTGLEEVAAHGSCPLRSACAKDRCLARCKLNPAASDRDRWILEEMFPEEKCRW